MSNWPSSKAKKVLTALQSIGWSVNGHLPQRQVDGGVFVVPQNGKAPLQQGGGLPGIDHQVGQAIHVQHPRRRELNGGHGLDQGQQHGHQRSIQVPYQRLAGVRKQRTPAFAEGARE